MPLGAILGVSRQRRSSSYKDDSRKGDTNGDGGATTPGAGDWVGIYDNSLTISSPYCFGWGNILYAGGS